MKNKMAGFLFAALLSLGAQTIARADGEPSAKPKKTKSNKCESDKDCKGILPAMCRKCDDGKNHCAHHVCKDNKCEVETCPPN